MAMKPKSSYKDNQAFALKMQPTAVKKYYKMLWPNARIIPLDHCTDELSKRLDIGGADKMLAFNNGKVAFLGQRFRRWNSRKYDDFTLRASLPSNQLTELGKVLQALDDSGFIVSYYSYGHVNEAETDFIRFRILLFRPLVEALKNKILQPDKTKWNGIGDSSFIVIHFSNIPDSYFLYDSEMHQMKLL